MTPEQIRELAATLKDKLDGCEAQITELRNKIEYWTGKAQGYFEAREEILNKLEESEASDEQ